MDERPHKANESAPGLFIDIGRHTFLSTIYMCSMRSHCAMHVAGTIRQPMGFEGLDPGRVCPNHPSLHQ